MNKNSTLFFVEQNRQQLIDKCIKSVLPRASTYVFSKNEETGELTFDELTFQDEERLYASGYITTYVGDSGSPYWKTDASNRAILIAIVSSKVGPKFEPKNILSVEEGKQCGNKASKVTEKIVSWIKQHAQIQSRGTKRTHEGEPV